MLNQELTYWNSLLAQENWNEELKELLLILRENSLAELKILSKNFDNCDSLAQEEALEQQILNEDSGMVQESSPLQALESSGDSVAFESLNLSSDAISVNKDSRVSQLKRKADLREQISLLEDKIMDLVAEDLFDEADQLEKERVTLQEILNSL